MQGLPNVFVIMGSFGRDEVGKGLSDRLDNRLTSLNAEYVADVYGYDP